MNPQTLARFQAKIAVDPDTGCWRWTASTDRGGYGQIYTGERTAAGHKRPGKAHRLSYEHYVGPIPDGLQIDHVYARGCRYRDCVNPEHLEVVTPHENSQRGARRRATHCPHGHPLSGNNLRASRNGWRLCKTCHRDRERERHRRQRLAPRA